MRAGRRLHTRRRDGRRWIRHTRRPWVGVAPVGQQTDLPGAHEHQRIQVVLAAKQAPMQARPVAVRAAGLGDHRAEHRARRDPLPPPDARADREVRRPHHAVDHRDHRPAPNRPRVADPAGTGGVHRLTRSGGEVDASVPGAPRRPRRLEAPADVGGPGEGEAPSGLLPARGQGGTNEHGTCQPYRDGDEGGSRKARKARRDPEGGGTPATWHGCEPRLPGRVPPARPGRLWRTDGAWDWGLPHRRRSSRTLRQGPHHAATACRP